MDVEMEGELWRREEKRQSYSSPLYSSKELTSGIQLFLSSVL